MEVAGGGLMAAALCPLLETLGSLPSSAPISPSVSRSNQPEAQDRCRKDLQPQAQSVCHGSSLRPPRDPGTGGQGPGVRPEGPAASRPTSTWATEKTQEPTPGRALGGLGASHPGSRCPPQGPAQARRRGPAVTSQGGWPVPTMRLAPSHPLVTASRCAPAVPHTEGRLAAAPRPQPARTGLK